MKYALATLAVLLFVATVRAEDPHKSWEIRGQVVDEQGVPVNDFVASGFWSANGKWNEEDQKKVAEENGDFALVWKEEGVLVPFSNSLAKQSENGYFAAEFETRGTREAIFVTDAAQRRGGVVSIEKTARDKLVTVTLHPLVRVTGKIYCSEAKKTPQWTYAGVHLPGDVTNELQFVFCGSLKGEFSFLLPPGKYDLDVYSEGPDAHMPKPGERKNGDAPPDMPKYLSGIRIDVPAGKAALDLGQLDVVPVDSDTLDYLTRFYGKIPPELSVTDARGVPKEVKLTDFRGKWVLLDFWGLRCQPCITQSLPSLAKFYELHAADRDRFEILAVCINWGDDVRTMEEFDLRAAPIIEKQWAGKPLPFPVLIDGDEKTFDAYHIGAVPAQLLIDPQGNLVKGGDAEMLAEKLLRPKP